MCWHHIYASSKAGYGEAMHWMHASSKIIVTLAQLLVNSILASQLYLHILMQKCATQCIHAYAFQDILALHQQQDSSARCKADVIEVVHASIYGDGGMRGPLIFMDRMRILSADVADDMSSTVGQFISS